MDCKIEVVRTFFLELDDTEAITLLKVIEAYTDYITKLPDDTEIIEGEGQLLSELKYNLRRDG
jgi:hypothetical protein